MMINELWPWITLALLGAYHGVNPAMGWLFAVGLGMQEGRREAVLRAFAPIALGHALSIAAVVAVVGLLQMIVPAYILQIVGAGALLLFAFYRIATSAAHPRWVGMRVGFRDLTTWSFLMSTAHGAGLMLVPVLLRVNSGMAHDHAAHAGHVAMASMGLPNTELLAVMLHTAAMFAVMAVVALVVYEKLGLRLLQRNWFNLDFLWNGALLLAGVVTLFTAGA
ncbi:MAG: hypothetical protein KDE53_35970 [Caldilineaceae bacterium]|nr:hypothetical protein [Caldilineaceae bacterium]MCB0126785.1 hypothetical protein [Caldilineaceae bacterium]